MGEITLGFLEDIAMANHSPEQPKPASMMQTKRSSKDNPILLGKARVTSVEGRSPLGIVHPNCAGMDVHKDSVTVCLITRDSQGQRWEEVRKFGTCSLDLLNMSDWLVQSGCDILAMESTGVYWKPVFNMVEGVMEVVLANPTYVKNISGDKTDTKDSRWIGQLLEVGLIRGSFIPPTPIRDLRDLTRYRRTLKQALASELNRLQKFLEDCNIKLGSVVSDIQGVSSRLILSAMILGVKDPSKAKSAEELAQLAKGRLKEKIPQLQSALEGRVRSHHARLMARILAHIDFLEQSIEEVERDIDAACAPFLKEVELLDTIPGVDKRAAQGILAEIGVDMEQFPSSKHLCSWAGVSPGNNESGGKRLSGKIHPGNKYLKATLTQCAHAAGRTKDTYASSLYRRFQNRRNTKHSAMVVSHHQLEACWYILKKHEPYRELGGDYFDKLKRNDAVHYYLRRLKELGVELPETVAA
jgi:transposase